MANFLEVDQLINGIFKMNSGSAVTKGVYSIESYCGREDLEWNQMDQDHRPFIHSTYLEAVRLWSTEESQLSLSCLKICGIKFYILVTDMRLKPGYYYQSFTIWNIFYIHAITTCTNDRQIGEWYIFSHWLLKPFHYFLNRKMKSMNEKQNPEDVLLRKRRAELRKLGYSFTYDGNLNFISANSKNNNVIYPKLNQSAVYDLKNLFGDMAINDGLISLLIKKEAAENEYRIFHGVCPHEGAPISESSFCGGIAKCRWHGLSFKGLILRPGEGEKPLFNMTLRIDENSQLHVSGNN